MFLSPGTLPEGERLYAGQEKVQVFLLLLAVAQVPIMLLFKPYYLRWEHNRARAKGYRGIGEVSRVSALDEDEDGRPNGHGDSFDDGEGVAMISENIEEEEAFEFSECLIHQTIHTIGIYPFLLKYSLEFFLTAYQSFALTPSHTLLPTSVFGLCRLPTSSLALSFGA